MTFRLGNRGWRLTSATVAICAAGGVAYAAIPGSNGVINGCYRSRQDLDPGSQGPRNFRARMASQAIPARLVPHARAAFQATRWCSEAWRFHREISSAGQ